jgi:nucleoside-diphosphate-sugar epimerase
MPCTILITGANGFIGSHVALLMESLGHRIVPLDIVSRSPDLSLLPIQTPSRILNIIDGAAFRELCQKEKPTHVFHAAHPPRNESPAVLDYCYHAMTSILEAAKAFGIKRVVYSSSASIYGQLKKPDRSLIKENDAVTIYPTYFYRAAKTVSEWMGDFYKEKHGVDFVALRCSSVYGPGLHRSIPFELKKGILGQPCRPFLTRPLDDPIYVDDVADAVGRALLPTNVSAAPTTSASTRRIPKMTCGGQFRRRCRIFLSKSAATQTPPKWPPTAIAIRSTLRSLRGNWTGLRRFTSKKESRGS